jgi:hypothetical protein
MNTRWIVLASTLLAIASLLLFTSCGDDDTPPPPPPQIGFKSSVSVVTEGQNGVVEFSIALPTGVTAVLSIGGTATEDEDYTYTVNSTGISFTILEDEIYDPNETIIVTITGFNGDAAVGTPSVHTITITDKDETALPGLRINLSWDAGGGGAGDVDMDMFLWIENPAGSGDFQIIGYGTVIGTDFEELFLPSNNPTNFPDRVYGMGYNYYEGSSDNLVVIVDFRSFKGNIEGTSNRARFTAVYTQANVNPYEDTGEYYIVQVFQKIGTNFANFSDIDVPESGSRYRSLQQKLKEAGIQKRLRGN